jgi:hypothetical protein
VDAADHPGIVSFDTQGSTFNTLLAVYDFNPNNPALGVNIVAQNDDYFPDGTSRVSFPYKANHLYIIAVDGYKGATGNITLSVNATPYKPPTAPIPQDVSGIYPSVVSSGCRRERPYQHSRQGQQLQRAIKSVARRQ